MFKVIDRIQSQSSNIHKNRSVNRREQIEFTARNDTENMSDLN